MSKPETQIVIRHISGAKINKIDQFKIAATKEIVFGREASTTVHYDSPKDDVVSRRHATIRVKTEAPLTFVVADLDSTNGTFVNGERLTAETELLPDDMVELGAGGPKFIFDIQPRPANLAARTRVLSTIETTPTRIMTAAGAAEAAATTQNLMTPQKVGVGKNTVELMLTQERRRAGQKWMGALFGLLAFVLVGGGLLYWYNKHTAEQLQQEAAQQSKQLRFETASAVTQQISTVTQQLGISAQDVVNKFGNSTVVVQFSWRLFDKDTGRAVFHKSWPVKLDNNTKLVRVPAYLKLPSGKIVPWLTTEDDEHKNFEVRGSGLGSGFVVGEQGFILTNKHIAAGWMVRVPPSKYAGQYGVLLTANSRGKRVESIIDVTKAANNDDLKSWTPEEDGGYLWGSQLSSSGLPDLKNSTLKTFYGRNETLEVRFPGSRLSINAGLVRASTDSDAALIKIESPQALTKLELAEDDTINVGERVIVLGYPGVSDVTFAQFTTNEAGQTRQRIEIIPSPTVTDGLVSRLGAETTQQGNIRIQGTGGDAIQLSVVATGAGNSGGPVFNTTGKVIGLFTWVTNDGGARAGFAVPVKYGRALLQAQKPPKT